MTARTFWHGCNYPWSFDGTTAFYGLDFGGNVWGSHLGVSTRRDRVAHDFETMARLGFTAARWFVFADGRGGIVYDERGLPSGLDRHVEIDMDVAFETAAAAGVCLVLVMLDHRWMFSKLPGNILDPVTGDTLQVRLPHGRAEILHSAEGRDALFHHVLEPLIARYGPTGARPDLSHVALAYELMNEPDFVVEEWESDRSRRVTRPLPFSLLAESVARFSDVVHARSTALTTLGGARVRNLWAWEDAALGLDILQVHSYPDVRYPGRDVDPFGLPASALTTSRPLVLGEFPGNGIDKYPAHAAPPHRSLGDYLSFAVDAGYAGAWPWSFSGTDDYGPLPLDDLRRFAAAHPELVHPRCAV